MTDFSNLEAELKALRPAQPSAELTARIEHSLGQSIPTAGVLPRRPKLRVNWLAIGLGLGAAAAFLLLARPKVDRQPHGQTQIASHPPAAKDSLGEAPQNLVPDELTRVVYQRSDEGLVFPPNSSAPVRKVRSHSRETLRWKNADTGASLRVSYPTEDVELIPISVQ